MAQDLKTEVRTLEELPTTLAVLVTVTTLLYVSIAQLGRIASTLLCIAAVGVPVTVVLSVPILGIGVFIASLLAIVAARLRMAWTRR